MIGTTSGKLLPQGRSEATTSGKLCRSWPGHSQSGAQFSYAALDAAAALLQLGQLDRHRNVPGDPQLRREPARLGAEHHVAPVADQVEPERERIRLVREQRRWEQLAEDAL